MCVSTISKLHPQISSGKDTTDWLDIRNIGICAYTFAVPLGLYKPVLPGTASVEGEYVYVQNCE